MFQPQPRQWSQNSLTRLTAQTRWSQIPLTAGLNTHRQSQTSEAATVRIEVTDTRTECVPVLAASAGDRDGGRGLLLVECLATRWDWHPRTDGPGKTVWAVLDVGVS